MFSLRQKLISKITKQKEFCVIIKCFGHFGFADQAPKHMDLCEYIAKKVPSLRLHEQSAPQQNGTSILKTLSSVMLSIQRYSICIVCWYNFHNRKNDKVVRMKEGARVKN
jgi:hypothetical protein